DGMREGIQQELGPPHTGQRRPAAGESGSLGEQKRGSRKGDGYNSSDFCSERGEQKRGRVQFFGLLLRKNCTRPLFVSPRLGKHADVGCHAHGFAWACLRDDPTEPNAHAHPKPWAWYPSPMG